MGVFKINFVVFFWKFFNDGKYLLFKYYKTIGVSTKHAYQDVDKRTDKYAKMLAKSLIK